MLPYFMTSQCATEFFSTYDEDTLMAHLIEFMNDYMTEHRLSKSKYTVTGLLSVEDCPIGNQFKVSILNAGEGKNCV